MNMGYESDDLELDEKRVEVTAAADCVEARTTAFDELARRGGGTIRTQDVPRVVIGDDWSSIASRAEHFGEALFCQINPAHQPTAAAGEFMGLGLPEIGHEILRQRSLSVAGLPPWTIVTWALHTTLDFSLILGDTVGRTRRASYQAAPAGVRDLARQTTARDFRLKQRLQCSECSTLQKVNENGEYEPGSMAETEAASRSGAVMSQ